MQPSKEFVKRLNMRVRHIHLLTKFFTVRDIDLGDIDLVTGMLDNLSNELKEFKLGEKRELEEYCKLKSDGGFLK